MAIESEMEIQGWINWPILLATAKTVWHITEELHAATLDPPVESSEIGLTMKPILERLTQARWAPAIPVAQSQQGIVQLQAFQAAFETVAAQHHTFGGVRRLRKGESQPYPEAEELG